MRRRATTIRRRPPSRRTTAAPTTAVTLIPVRGSLLPVGTGAPATPPVGLGVGLSMPMFGGGGAGRYTADMDIVLHDGAKPQENPNAYDAFSVISRLQPKVLTGGS